VSNAIKFSEPGGRVAVSVRRDSDEVAIDVADAGVGIDPEFLPYVFDRFRQADSSSARRHGGLGLGLAIARQLVELQGGTITVASGGAGRGATFTVHLPIHQGGTLAEQQAAPTAALAEDALVPSHGSLAGLTLLVVDDERDSLELVQQVLSETGARIVTATSAGDALRMAERYRPDLLISDIGMPLMDGFELIRHIRAERDKSLAGVPAIALTAFSRREDQQRALEAGFDEYLAKPLRPAVLLQTVVGMAGRAALGVGLAATPPTR
jgi:CheY-like chemotaxis protein